MFVPQNYSMNNQKVQNIGTILWVTVCVFYAVSLFLSDLVFSNCEMKKEHDRIMVESEGYCEIVCFLFIYFILSDIFAWCMESLDEYQDGIESTRLN